MQYCEPREPSQGTSLQEANGEERDWALGRALGGNDSFREGPQHGQMSATAGGAMGRDSFCWSTLLQAPASLAFWMPSHSVLPRVWMEGICFLVPPP